MFKTSKTVKRTSLMASACLLPYVHTLGPATAQATIRRLLTAEAQAIHVALGWVFSPISADNNSPLLRITVSWTMGLLSAAVPTKT